MLRKTIPLLPLYVILLFSSQLSAEGYVSASEGGSVQSRVALCATPQQDKQDADCELAYEQIGKLIAASNYPDNSIPDEQIASAGKATFNALNEQTQSRWVKNPISAGEQTFEWSILTPQVTKNYQYYITKQNWNPNQPLTRDSFEDTPFCQINGSMTKPGKKVWHQCMVPERTGYQVILAIWNFGNQNRAVYNVIDTEFVPKQPAASPWKQVGMIAPAVRLVAGDSVYAKVFDYKGERPEFETKLVITNDAAGQPDVWAHDLAQKINHTQTQIRAGKPAVHGFAALIGNNPLFLYRGSRLTHVEIGYELATSTPEQLAIITGLNDEYLIENDQAEFDVTVTSVGDLDLELIIRDEENTAYAYKKLALKDGDSRQVDLLITNVNPGRYQLELVVKNAQAELIDNKKMTFYLIKPTEQCGDDPNASQYPDWVATTVYTGGEKVNYHGLIWRAKYWVQGHAPDQHDSWKLESNVPVAWVTERAYSGGEKVIFNNRVYQAKWWTNTSPAKTPQAWLDKGIFNCP